MRHGVSVQEYMAVEGNVDKYRRWRDSPETQRFLQLVRDECTPASLPIDATGRVQHEVSEYVHGQNVGEHRVLNRLGNLDEVITVPEDVLANYNAVHSLVEMGYTEADAQRIVKEQNNG